jgi:hypothetical protein
MGALEQHMNSEKLVTRLSPLSARFASVLANDQPSRPLIEQLNKAMEPENSAIRTNDIQAMELPVGERGHVHSKATSDAAAGTAPSVTNRTPFPESKQTRSRISLPRGGRANGRSPRRTVNSVLQRKNSNRLNASRLSGRDARPTFQPLRTARRTSVGSIESSSILPSAAVEPNFGLTAAEQEFQGGLCDIHLGGWEPGTPTESVRAPLRQASISPIVVPPTQAKRASQSASGETGQSCQVEASDNGLAPA